jgi:hypothetical protein
MYFFFITYISMSLRAARNVFAGRHWPAGRTLRTNGLDTLTRFTGIHLCTENKSQDKEQGCPSMLDKNIPAPNRGRLKKSEE